MPDASRGMEEFTMYCLDLFETGDLPGIAATFSTVESAGAFHACDKCHATGHKDQALNRTVFPAAGSFPPRTSAEYWRATQTVTESGRESEHAFATDTSAFEVLNSVYSGGFDVVDRRGTDLMHHVSGVVGKRTAHLAAGSRNTNKLPPATITKPALLKVNPKPTTAKQILTAKRKT